VVSGGGLEVVYSGGRRSVSRSSAAAAPNEVSAGGLASGATLSGGTQIVFGTTSGTTANSGSREWIFAGGTDIAATLNGGIEIADHATILGITVNSGGSAGIIGSSTASGTTVNSGGLGNCKRRWCDPRHRGQQRWRAKFRTKAGLAISSVINAGGVPANSPRPRRLQPR